MRLILLLVSLVCALDAAARELLADSHLVRGVEVVPVAQTRGKLVERICLPLRDCSLHPVWLLQQWGSAVDLRALLPVQQGDAPAWQHSGQWTVADARGNGLRQLVVAPADRELGDVLLAIDGRAEFAARNAQGIAHYPASLREPWPHWLLSQQLDTGRLSQYRSVQLSGQLRLREDLRQQQTGYDPALHAARLVLAMTVRNRLNGRYFWLNLALYDDRYPQSGFGCSKCMGDVCRVAQSLAEPGEWRCPQDSVSEPAQAGDRRATGSMIFRMPGEVFVHGELRHNDWVSVAGDLLPYIRAGIAAARAGEPAANSWQRFPEDLHFYEIGLFSIGWEITGFNRVAVQLRDWRLHGEEMPDP